MHKIILAISLLTIVSCFDSKQDNTKEDTSLLTDNSVAENKSIQSENEVPDFLDVELIGYKTADINLKSYAGEVIFINFWGSWCPPCRIEMPSIQALYDDYGDKVKFVTIAFEREKGKHMTFIDENGYTFPVYEATSPMSSELKPQGFPTTIIIDKVGNILIKDIGAKDWNSVEVREELNKLLE